MPSTQNPIAATNNAPRSSSAIILTTFDDDESVYASLRAGASGFLVKDMAVDDIPARRPAGTGSCPARRLIAGLTEREWEVLTLVGRGLPNAEIAGELFISVATAKAHVAHLLAKLDARDRVQLVIAVYESGLVWAAR